MEDLSLHSHFLPYLKKYEVLNFQLYDPHNIISVLTLTSI